MESSAVVVLGSPLARTRRLLVEEAERAAARLGSELVVFSGCSPDGGPSEAAQMRDLWRGPETVDIAVEETASTTAENAARTLPLLLGRGVSRAVVICAPLHLFRARWIFRNVYEQRDVRVRVRAARVAPTPGAVAWELAALAVVARQIRAARSELDRR